MDAQEVKISEVSDMSNDLRMVIVKDNKHVLKEIKLTNDENIELPKKMKAIVNYGLEVEETTPNK
jgi:predicted component of type VI protein secretion system